MESFSVSRATNIHFKPDTPQAVIDSVQNLINEQIGGIDTLDQVVERIELMHGKVTLSDETTFDLLVEESVKTRCREFTAEDGSHGLILIYEEDKSTV